MKIRWRGYEVTVRPVWIATAGVVAVSAVWAWWKGWLLAAALATLVAIGIVAGPGIDIKRIDDIPPNATVQEMEDYPIDEIERKGGQP